MRWPIPALVVVAAWATPAAAQIDEAATLLFVPELTGALTVDVQLEGRFDGVLADSSRLPENTLKLHLGYLHYLQGHGRFGVGGYLGGGFSIVEGDAPTVGSLDAGAIFRMRGISADFYHWSLGLFVEAGPLFLGAPLAPDEPEVGFRWASGVETGPGLLFHLDPFVFAESTARLGVESTGVGGRRVTALFAAMRIVFDFALRRGRIHE